MGYNDRSTPLALTIVLQGKMKPTSEQELSTSSQGSQNSLALADTPELESPVSPLCTPSPSARIDDTISDLSVLSPYTPLMSMPPTPDTPQQVLAREYDSPSGLSPSASALSLDPSMQSPSAYVSRSLPKSHENLSVNPLKDTYRAKAKGLQFHIPTRSPRSGPSLLSPMDATRQQEVHPLPSPMARDLRRRVEASDEATEVDIAAYEEDSYYLDAMDASDSDVEREPESSCLGLDLGLPASHTGEMAPYLDSNAFSRGEAREEEETTGVDEFGAQIMQGMLAHSASAELVSSPKKSRDRHLDSTQACSGNLKPPVKTAPKASIPLPESHLKSPFSSLPLARQTSTPYTIPVLPQPTTPPTQKDASYKTDIRESNSRVGPSGDRLLGAGPPSPSPKRTGVGRNASNLMQLRMHGQARFPQHFPEGYLLVAKFAQMYRLETELGAGGYGFVLGAHNMMTGEEVAVKFITRSSVLARGLVRDYKNDIVPLEAVVLRLAQHPGVVQFRGLYEDDLYFYLVQELHGSPWSKNAKNQHKPDQGPDSLEGNAQAQHESARSKPSSPVSPYAPTQSSPLRHCMPSMPAAAVSAPSRPGGLSSSLPLPARPQMPRRASYDLFECIEQHERLSEGQAKYIFAQVVDTVQYLDSIGITHRDLKDENLVIDKDFKVKMIDFGSAVIRDVRKPPPVYTCFFGTVTFASPEILKDLPYTAPPAEVWALGILLSFLVTGQSPFPTREHAMHRVMCGPDASIVVSPLCGDLINKCLEPDPVRRLTVYQVREHPWLRGALDRA